MLQTRWEHLNHLCLVSLQMLQETLRSCCPDVVALPAELSPLLELCFPHHFAFSSNSFTFPSSRTEATRVVSEYLDLTFLERSNLVRSSSMSPSIVSESFSRSIIYPKTSYSSGKTWRNKRQTFSSEISVPLARKSRASSAISRGWNRI